MSKVKKYDPFGYDGLSAFMTECEHGDFVRATDYAALEAERDALRQQLAERDAEIERLRHSAAQELAERLATKLIESGSENYQESHFDLEFEGSGIKCVAVVRLQHPDKPSPHELRRKAEAQRDKLAGLLREVCLDYTTAIHWEDMHAIIKRIDAALAEVE